MERVFTTSNLSLEETKSVMHAVSFYATSVFKSLLSTAFEAEASSVKYDCIIVSPLMSPVKSSLKRVKSE